MSDHYKSQITDDEVIKELIRDSKKREGKLPTEVTRLKPNLNFFQRTVNGLVSNNTRIDKTQHTFKNEYLQDEKPPDSSENGLNSPSKLSIDYAFEREVSLQKKIHFIKSLDPYSTGLIKPKAKIEIKKINFVVASTNISNRQGSSNIYNKKSHKKGNQKIFNILSSDSEEDTPKNDVGKIISSDNNKTTCKTYSSKSQRVKLSDVVCILSDSETVEVISSESDSSESKRKVKKQTKKRKRDKGNEKLVEESEKSVKRKKQKKKSKKHKD